MQTSPVTSSPAADTRVRIIGWIALGAVGLGQVLPWGRGVPAGQVWDILFSPISQPNAEWWIWFLAPTGALIVGIRGLVQDGTIHRVALVPAGIFLAAWAALFLTGIRRYLDFSDPGFLLTFVGLVLIGVLALQRK